MADSQAIQIGIKMADGSFYPVFTEDFKGMKRLVLTTARHNQPSVQIDFYKGRGAVLFPDSYIGSIIIENIPPQPKKEPEIELFLGITEDGNLKATASDLKSGEKQSLSVSLTATQEPALYEMPEFELGEGTEAPGTGLPAAGQEMQPDFGSGHATAQDQAGKRKINPLAMVLFILAGLALVALLSVGIYFLLNALVPHGATPSPTLPPATSAPLPSPQATTQALASPRTTSAALATAAPQATEKPATATVPAIAAASPGPAASAPAEGKGMWYTVKRGDTLWDISRLYYRDPWAYVKIVRAKENYIPNPDLIFENQALFLPEN